MRRAWFAMTAVLAVGGCQNGGIPSLGLNSCALSGIGIGAAGGALAGALISHNWEGALIGGAVGGGAGYVATKVFAEELGCEDQKRLVTTTQRAAVQQSNHRVAYPPATTSGGQTVSGYVMPVGNWHTDSDGRQVRTVKEVLTDGHSTQTKTVEVASNDVDTSQGGYVLPR
jgi:hypothetical protein